MILNEYFDKIYCINLDRRTDRWSKINKKFKEIGINVQRVSACDYRNIPEEKGTPKQRGRYACAESHYKVIKDAKENGYEKILIFEDDCEFPENLNDVITPYINKIPNNWDLLMFGYYSGQNFKLPEDEKSKLFFKIQKNKTKHDGLWATHAYALKQTLFDVILSQKNGAFSEMPHEDNGTGYGGIDITYFYAIHGYFNCYATYKSLIQQDKIDTDIDVNSNSTKVY